jgi:hypothetical protein
LGSITSNRPPSTGAASRRYEIERQSFFGRMMRHNGEPANGEV